MENLTSKKVGRWFVHRSDGFDADNESFGDTKNAINIQKYMTGYIRTKNNDFSTLNIIFKHRFSKCLHVSA